MLLGSCSGHSREEVRGRRWDMRERGAGGAGWGPVQHAELWGHTHTQCGGGTALL